MIYNILPVKYDIHIFQSAQVIISTKSRQRIRSGLFLVYGSFVEQVKFHVFCLTVTTLPFSFCDSGPAIGRLYDNISYLDLQRNFTVILYTL